VGLARAALALHDHAERPVRLCPWPGGEPVGHLGLHHEHGALAAGTVGFAYHAAAEPAPPARPAPPKPKQSTPSEVMIATDEERFQGTWRCVRGEEDGHAEEVKDGGSN